MKRLVAGLLWSFVTMWIGSYVAIIVGVTTSIAIPIAALAGAFVVLDPLTRIWPAPRPTDASERASPALPDFTRS